MKVNKLISRGLALGFLLNSVSVLSYANTEIPNRYQTLEGEYITIDDSTAGNLEEIEIFGNTVQDPTNLEDIQSVGDLYVDDEGSPILDNQGKRQYKIDIISGNKLPIIDEFNTSKLNNIYNLRYKQSISFHTYNHTKIGDYIQLHFKIRKLSDSNINKSTILNNIAFSFLGTGGYEQGHITIDEWNNLKIGESIEKTFIRQLSVNESFRDHLYFGFGLRPINSSITDSESYLGDFIIENIDFDIVASSKYYPPEKSKTTILLPCKLMKVGNIADRLYWDNNRGKYVIEKNIISLVLNGTEKYDIFEDSNEYLSQYTNTPFIKSVISNKLPVLRLIYSEGEGITYDYDTNRVFIKLFKSRLGSKNIPEWLKENNLDVYYAVSNEGVSLIETNITSKLKIPTYNEKTHIYLNSENGINPTLKVTVDRIEQVSQEAVNIALSNPTTYNLSLARMLVNQLSESLYKDQLQEQLNNIFSNEVVLEKKNATANLDLYIKSENILQMSLSTNSITFDDFSGVEDMIKENAVQISINSSLPYSLNAYLPTEIQNSDKSNTMNKDILNIKENSELKYKTFINTIDKIILKDNNPAGNNINHGIDIKLKGNIAHQKDIYKTTIKFEAQQR